MTTRVLLVCFYVASAFILCSSQTAVAEDVYCGRDTCYSITPSDQKLAVQFDTTGQVPDLETFFENHPTLDDTVEALELERGFLIIGIHPDSEYDSAYADVIQDESVNRCVPVYVTEVGGAEIPVTDLVTVLFAPTLSTDSANTLLNVHGLSLVSVNDYRSDLWVAALHDSIKESPLDSCPVSA